MGSEMCIRDSTYGGDGYGGAAHALPPGGRHGDAPDGGVPGVDPFAAPPSGTAQCAVCGRSFNADRLGAHERICAKLSGRRRPEFVPSFKRAHSSGSFGAADDGTMANGGGAGGYALAGGGGGGGGQRRAGSARGADGATGARGGGGGGGISSDEENLSLIHI